MKKTRSSKLTQQDNWINGKTLIELISACKTHGVVQFKLKDLLISFDVNYNTNQSPNIVSTELSGSEPRIKPEPKETLEDLMLSNPVAYEEALTRDDDDGTDG